VRYYGTENNKKQAQKCNFNTKGATKKMSTRSYICRENEDGTYTGIYCHSDGYLTHNGALLIDHYTDREKVDKLLSLGNLSYLQPTIDPNPEKPHQFEPEEINGKYAYQRQDGVCLFYGRDRGEKDQQAFSVKLNEVGKNIWIEYCYVFTRDGKWKYFEPYDSTPVVVLLDVETDLNAEFASYGVKRPPNEYGFFSQESIEFLKAEQARQSDADSEM
jgi:hypothetical protein